MPHVGIGYCCHLDAALHDLLFPVCGASSGVLAPVEELGVNVQEIGPGGKQQFNLRIRPGAQFEDAPHQAVVLNIPADGVGAAALEVEQQVSFAAANYPSTAWTPHRKDR